MASNFTLPFATLADAARLGNAFALAPITLGHFHVLGFLGVVTHVC